MLIWFLFHNLIYKRKDTEEWNVAINSSERKNEINEMDVERLKKMGFKL